MKSTSEVYSEKVDVEDKPEMTQKISGNVTIPTAGDIFILISSKNPFIDSVKELIYNNTTDQFSQEDNK